MQTQMLPFVMMIMIVFVNNIAILQKNYEHFKLLFDLDSVLSEITSHEVIPLCWLSASNAAVHY